MLIGFIKTWLTGNSPYTTSIDSIHIIDDDSLLNIFHLYRPFPSSEDEDGNTRLWGGVRWVGERWLYGLAHVFQRWRNIILGSVSYLSLCLVRIYRTPVAFTPAHSPVLPLVVDYQYHDTTAEEEDAIFLALERSNSETVPGLYHLF